MSDSETRRGQKAKHLFPLSFITFLEGITSAFLPLLSVQYLCWQKAAWTCSVWEQGGHSRGTGAPCVTRPPRCQRRWHIAGCVPVSPRHRSLCPCGAAGHSSSGSFAAEPPGHRVESSAETALVLYKQSERVRWELLREDVVLFWGKEESKES